MIKWFAYFLAFCIGFAASAQSYEVNLVPLNSAGSANMCPVKFGEGFVYMSNEKTEYLRTIKDETGSFPFNFHLAIRDTSGKVKKTKPFASEIGSLFNDGPLTFFEKDSAMIFSRNQNIDKIGKRSVSQKMGLFVSFYRNGEWSQPEALPFNSDEYNCTHPAISVSGTELIFASDQPGGMGGMDLYSSTYNSGSWSTPKNLGPNINSVGNEVFPFRSNNVLIFSTDGREKDVGLDFYKAVLTDQKWNHLIRLDTTINSIEDDFGFSSFDNGKQGYFTSNREGNKDQIYAYSQEYPEPDSCVGFREIFYCFLLEDYNSLDESEMPLKFQWEMGDGTILDGYKVIHCYDTLGMYEAKLNVIDTVFNEVYTSVTEVMVEIEAEDSPYLIGPDTVAFGETVNLAIDLQYYSIIPEFVYWKMNGKFVTEGEKIQVISKEKDSLVVSMVWQLSSGQTLCMDKVIYIQEGYISSFQSNNGTLDESDNTITEIRVEEPTEEPIFSVRLLESSNKIDLSDSLFQDVDYEILERYVKVEDLYDYSVGVSKKMDDLYYLYREMKDLGFDAEVIEYQIEEEGGALIAKDNVSVFFAVSSTELTEYNLYNIEQFTKSLSPKTNLSVVGFADVTGNANQNQKLSEERAKRVKVELMKLGFKANNIKVSGKGGVGENDQASGAMQVNRKVEIYIVN